MDTNAICVKFDRVNLLGISLAKQMLLTISRRKGSEVLDFYLNVSVH